MTSCIIVYKTEVKYDSCLWKCYILGGSGEEKEMNIFKVTFFQDLNQPPEDNTPSLKENQKNQSGTNIMITTHNMAFSGE